MMTYTQFQPAASAPHLHAIFNGHNIAARFSMNEACELRDGPNTYGDYYIRADLEIDGQPHVAWLLSDSGHMAELLPDGEYLESDYANALETLSIYEEGSPCDPRDLDRVAIFLESAATDWWHDDWSIGRI